MAKDRSRTEQNTKAKKIYGEDEVIDPQKNKESFLKWNKKFPELTADNEVILLQFIGDMEKGRNVTGTKGPRSYVRLNTIRHRMNFITRLIEKEYNKKRLVDLTEKEVIDAFHKMSTGELLKRNGEKYTYATDYVKIFKAFWHWHQRAMHRQHVEVEDITIDLNAERGFHPNFNYFTIEQLQKLLDNAKYEYRVLMMFIFDTGIRSPKELYNVRKKDLTEEKGVWFLNIRENSAKTFGRKIKIMLFPEQIKAYIKDMNPEETLFSNTSTKVNQYLKRLGKRVLDFGEIKTNSQGEEFIQKGLTMYDFRHCSACYWLPRYPNEQSLKYKFGWKNNEEIFYYTHFLGMSDQISEEHLVDTETRTRIERELDQERQQRALMEEELTAMREQLERISKIVIQGAIEEIKNKSPQST